MPASHPPSARADHHAAELPPPGQGHDHRHSPGHGHSHGADQDLADLLDLDAQVLPFGAEIVEWVSQLLPDAPQHVVDLGAGTGHGSLVLAACFSSAHITAVDQSSVMVARSRARFDAAGLQSRSRVVLAEVGAGWRVDQPVDLVWASAVLHEVDDPQALLAAVSVALRPGGWLAVVEMDGPPHFLPHDLGLGEPGLEDRLHRALATSDGRAMHPRWGTTLEESGFVDVVERRFTLEVDPPAPATAPFVAAYLTRVRPWLGDRVSASDLAVVDALVSANGPHALARRADLTVRASRTAWLARRP